MRNVFFDTMDEILEKNSDVVLVLSDGLDFGKKLKDKYNDRVVECGIAENNVVGVSAGLADMGLIPYVFVFGAFLTYRAYEFIRNDVCLQNKNVKLFAHACGISNNNFGPTHHTTEDIAVLSPLPNLEILSPASGIETKLCMYEVLRSTKPQFIRLGKTFGRELLSEDYEYHLSNNILSGEDVTVFSTGNILVEALDAAEELKKEGISLNVVHLPSIKPLDKDAVIKEAKKTGNVIVLEEHSVIGGLGSLIAKVLFENKVNVNYKNLGLKDEFCKLYGPYSVIKEEMGISKKQVIEEARIMCRIKKERQI